MKIYQKPTQLIGQTPMLDVSSLVEDAKARILVKIEGKNLAGSVKDRVALKMIEVAEKDGKLEEGSVIIEPTSGNTGVGLAAIAAMRGYRCIIVMPEGLSQERQTLMKAYGAEVILTPGDEGMKGAIAKAEELTKTIDKSFIPDQFANPANAEAHYETTGPEIWEQTEGQIDVFIAGVGTGGTVTGVGRYLKEQRSDIEILALEPAESAVLSGGKAGSHGIQGIGAGFVPDVLDTSVYDRVVTVKTEDAKETSRLMGRCMGLLIGISAGAALHAALELAKDKDYEGKTIVALLPDGGDRYLSTDLYVKD